MAQAFPDPRADFHGLIRMRAMLRRPGLGRAFLAQRGHLFPWVPVCLGVGIGLYFSLRFEPSVWLLLGVAILGVIALRQTTLDRGLGPARGPLLTALLVMGLGFSLAGARAHWVEAPVLPFRYYGPIEGRIVKIDRSSSDAVRLTLDRVVLERMNPEHTPARVRVSLHGDLPGIAPRPGATVMLTGHLDRPGGAVEPGGFDFRRHAYFLRLGAVGYSRNPVMLLEPPGRGLWVFKARIWLSARVRAQLDGDTGAFAAAIMSGDRSDMSQATLQALRDTNLAHLLAISGLHMGLLAGFVFSAVRLILLSVRGSRHHWPIKKLAALAALSVAAGYLGLSGGNIATQRAFVMAAAGLVALMVDRRVLSLRAVAIAALIVLVLRPEALLSPGFQMSFAATTALIAVFEKLTQWQSGRDLPRWFGPVLGVVVSSAVAGAATAPIGMAHFNQASVYGLVANLVSVPVMGILVVPFGVVAALLMPLGLDWIALAVMSLGLDWILGVAHHLAGWEGATRPVITPGPDAFLLIIAGGLFLCIWRGSGRLVGIVPMILGAMIWARSDRPDILISAKGNLAGVLSQTGRDLSREKGAGFVARNWLENDGSARDQSEAALGWTPVGKRVVSYQLGDKEIVHATGKTGARQIESCHAGQIIVSDKPLDIKGNCLLFDQTRLAQYGAVALWQKDRGWKIVTDRQITGTRLWTALP
ncbi:MAG: ComEC family competence protein [Pelagimonas sp.]|jgi:competence protein ComEC|nr:ComEC family competence protein [Pelagimonas sp.]